MMDYLFYTALALWVAYGIFYLGQRYERRRLGYIVQNAEKNAHRWEAEYWTVMRNQS